MAERLLYLQIEEQIRERIHSGYYPAGSQLPTEMELVEEFGASRLTIGKSLSQLVAEGLISRTRGRGSFVRPLAHGGGSAAAAPGLIRYVSPVAGSDDDISRRHGILSGIHDTVRANEYSVGVDFFSSVAEEVAILRDFTKPLNSAYVVWPSNDPEVVAELRQLIAAGFPFVLVDTFFPELNSDCVLTDNTLGARRMMEYLVKLGHRRIAYLTIPLDRTSLSERFSGVISAAGTFGLDTGRRLGLIPGGRSINSQEVREAERAFIREWAAEQMKSADRPTAIFCSNDSLALTLCEIFREMRISVPGEVSVAGFDNVSIGEWLPTPLTTVDHDFVEIGHCAGEILLSRLQQKSSASTRPLQYRIAPKLLVRGTTAPPPEGTN